ncbi:Alpha/Beta hydrolase protein [Linnemannia elongata]|nr:Alpha/Beta hydrolase protein [Linnemannia elongata]
MTIETIDITLPNYGTIRGSVDTQRQVAIFRNVPYAHVTERWRVAVKVQPWSGVRDATVQGPVQPQGPTTISQAELISEEYRKIGPHPINQYGLEHSERDGLNLNITVPLSALKAGAAPIPVMTYIYGGSLCNGNNAIPLYDARNLVEHSVRLDMPVLVVQPNYRVAAFGFLASKELQDDMDEYVRQSQNPIPVYNQSVGNWGLQDQKLAFEWVRENIAALGGDNKNVTAFGQSAGSLSLHHHMVLPAHHGLFDHAILQSGAIGALPTGTVEQDGQATFDALVAALGIPADLPALEKVKRLRAVPAEELTTAGEAASLGLPFRPFHDGGKVLPSTIPLEAWSSLPSSYDPNLKSVMIGANKNEGFGIDISFGERNLKTWPGLLNAFAPTPHLKTLFKAAYGSPETDEDVVKIVAEYPGDLVFQYPIERAFNALVQVSKAREGKFHLERYHFDLEIEQSSLAMPGCGSIHGGELLYVFDPPMNDDAFTEAERAAAREVQKRWIAFANQKPVVVGDGKSTASAKKGQAVVWTKDYEIKVGKGVRLSDDVLAFWGAVMEVKLEKIQQGLDAHRKEI